MATTRKDDRLNLRVTPEERKLLQAAADLENSTLTEFILKAARFRAEQTLADQTEFKIAPEKFQAFMAALENQAFMSDWATRGGHTGEKYKIKGVIKKATDDE